MLSNTPRNFSAAISLKTAGFVITEGWAVGKILHRFVVRLPWSSDGASQVSFLENINFQNMCQFYNTRAKTPYEHAFAQAKRPSFMVQNDFLPKHCQIIENCTNMLNDNITIDRRKPVSVHDTSLQRKNDLACAWTANLN